MTKVWASTGGASRWRLVSVSCGRGRLRQASKGLRHFARAGMYAVATRWSSRVGLAAAYVFGPTARPRGDRSAEHVARTRRPRDSGRSRIGDASRARLLAMDGQLEAARELQEREPRDDSGSRGWRRLPRECRHARRVDRGACRGSRSLGARRSQRASRSSSGSDERAYLSRRLAPTSRWCLYLPGAIRRGRDALCRRSATRRPRTISSTSSIVDALEGGVCAQAGAIRGGGGRCDGEPSGWPTRRTSSLTARRPGCSWPSRSTALAAGSGSRRRLAR